MYCPHDFCMSLRQVIKGSTGVTAPLNRGYLACTPNVLLPSVGETSLRSHTIKCHTQARSFGRDQSQHRAVSTSDLITQKSRCDTHKEGDYRVACLQYYMAQVHLMAVRHGKREKNSRRYSNDMGLTCPRSCYAPYRTLAQPAPTSTSIPSSHPPRHVPPPPRLA